MDILQAIEKRRSIRRYKPDPIPRDVLDKLLDAVRSAPSGCNLQPWTFVVVRDKDTRQRLAEACRYRNSPKGQVHVQRWVAEAPVIIVACGHERKAAGVLPQEGGPVIADGRTLMDEMGKRPAEYTSSMHWDLAIALEHLALAAVGEGLGTCWIGGLDEDQVKRLLSVPDDVRVQLAMCVGYPASSWPSPRPRKLLEEIICYDRYG
jgi:nitroreductase